MPPAGFERTISAGERPQTYTLDRWLLGPAGGGDVTVIKIVDYV